MQLDRPPPTLLGRLPEGAAGTRATLQLMSALVRQHKKPGTQTWTLAHQLVADVPPKYWLGEVQALHEFVRDHIRYTRDTHQVESVQTPDATLAIGQGDCDDKSVLLASLLEAIGHPTRFVAVGMVPNQYQHVFVQTQVGTRWVSCDPTENVPVGWAPARVQAVMVANN